MLIINDKPGQLGNQLWSYAPFIAFCLKNKVTFLTLYFEDNYHLFENLNRFDNIRFGLARKGQIDIYFRKILLRGIRTIPESILKSLKIFASRDHWKNESWDEPTLLNNSNFVFLGAATHRKTNLYLEEFHENLRLIFQPKATHRMKVEQMFNTARRNFDIIVGVHIRRGDYQEFLGGIYYFGDDTYNNYILQIANDTSLSGKKIGFLLCSNDSLDIGTFAPHGVFQIDSSTGIEDLYGLSLCDFIFGPPSTFSMWASYYGHVPLKFIKYKTEDFSIKDFSVIVAQDTFANGSVLTHD
jgi:hypothetical protein